MFKALSLLVLFTASAMATPFIQLKDAIVALPVGNAPNTAFVSGIWTVLNVEFQKEVKVHLSANGGAWNDYPATYLHPVNDGSNTELWSFNISVPLVNNTGSYQFAGEVITPNIEPQGVWDNNNGANYVLSYPGDPAIFGPGVEVILISQQLGYAFHAGPYLYLCAAVNNLAYQKTVNFILSADATKTFSKTYTAAASYVSSPSRSEDVFCASIFLSSIPDVPLNTPYYIQYQVAGQTYYDNNNGLNYAYTGSF